MIRWAFLLVLWRMFEGHPKLLPAFFEDERGSDAPLVARSSDVLACANVRMPLFSRKRFSVRIVEEGKVTEAAEDKRYDENPMIVQASHPLPILEGSRSGARRTAALVAPAAGTTSPNDQEPGRR